MPSIAPSIFNPTVVDPLRRELRIDPYQVRRLRTALLKHFQRDEAILATFPLANQLGLHALTLFQRHDSALDGASKLLFKTDAGLLIESVILRIASGRTTICVSSQVGCAAACEFCATGKMGIARNLSPEEIVDQVLQAGQTLAAEGKQIRNVVFMGMGEPFHNQANLHSAIGILIDPVMFHLSPKNILVSTVGVTDGMLGLAKRFPSVNQALSLHSVRQEVRERLIPMARKYPLSQLRSTVADLNQKYGLKVMLEYLMLAGVNDSADDADELKHWASGLNVHLNLIPYNPIDAAPALEGSGPETIQAFAAVLKSAGLKTTIRRSLGGDIAAACGQLVRRENISRRRNQPLVSVRRSGS